MIKRFLLFIILFILVIAGWYGKPFLFQTNEHPELSTESFEALFPGVAIPTFTEAPVNFSHQLNDGPPFAGSALIDINGDGVDEIFIGGGKGQADALMAFRDGGFLNILPAPEDLSEKLPSLGSISVDADDDGDLDIIIARPDDLYLLKNEEEGFSEAQLNLEIPERSVPFSVAAADINKDGLLDFYVSTFIDMQYLKPATFNDPEHRTANILLMGDKEKGLVDATSLSGIDFKQNTFLSSFVDLDNDGWQDLVIAPNTDKVRLFKNIEGGRFEEIESPSGYGFWMGMAIADVDQDGDQDLFFSNSGNTLPEYISQGDLSADQVKNTNWILLENKGDFQFVEKNLDGFEFAWGASFADLNNDGIDELIVAENYIKWVAHKLNPLAGRILMRDKENNWQPITELTGALNENFAMTPLVSDFNRDGYPDIFYVNIDGPSKAYLSEGGEAHFLKVIMPDTVKSMGALVSVEMESGKIITKPFINSSGFLSDPSTTLHFGLGVEEEISKLTVDWSSGEQTIKLKPEVNTRIFIDEE